MSTTGSYLYTAKSLLPNVEGNNPDVLVVEAAELAIGIDQIRQAIHFLSIKPLGEEEKMVIIKDAEKMTDEAQNCLLKTLEEPPENTTIILQTPDPELLLPTVVSRCQVVYGKEEKETAESFDQRMVTEMDRKTALEWIRKALIYYHEDVVRWHDQIRALFRAQKYLKANTNVRLTLENLLLKL